MINHSTEQIQVPSTVDVIKIRRVLWVLFAVILIAMFIGFLFHFLLQKYSFKIEEKGNGQPAAAQNYAPPSSMVPNDAQASAGTPTKFVAVFTSYEQPVRFVNGTTMQDICKVYPPDSGNDSRETRVRVHNDQEARGYFLLVEDMSGRVLAKHDFDMTLNGRWKWSVKTDQTEPMS